MTQTHTARILVVDDHDRARESMADILRHAGHQVKGCLSADDALKHIDAFAPDIVLTDLQMPGMNGLDFIRTLAQRECEAQIVMITAFASVATAVEAMRNGAFDYIEKPFDADQLESLVDRALRHGDRHGKRSSVPAPADACAFMIGASRAMQQLRAKIAQVAPTGETVLITGESGTGKELVAKAIHAASGRGGKAFVGVNCPALSPQLMESELFGHERGAFTSADAPRVGRFELADGGTLLLDEVTEIDLPLQAKLLRVLQERSFERVGSSENHKVDVRVVAATNRNLLDEVRQNRFRQDLYYRLNVVPISVPALRDRIDDVPLLADHFLRQASSRLNRPADKFAHSAYGLLQEYHWPGNVRELENIVTRASVLSSGHLITADELRPWLAGEGAQTEIRTSSGVPVSAGKLDDMERRLIETTLERLDGHREKTAKALGIGVRTLSNKLRQYGYGPRAKLFAKAG